MELRPHEQDDLTRYLDQFAPLIGDARTQRTLVATIQGILAAESLCWSRIAAASPALAAVP